MGVEKVVEELHVELVILHDQNGFCLGVHRVSPGPRGIAGVTEFGACAVLKGRS
jgi:hypothetical protein